MKHKVAGKHLNRNSAHRKALRMNFTVAVIKHERVTTTLAKAKAMRAHVEKMITLAKKGDDSDKLHRIRQAVSHLQDKTAVKKLFDVIAPRYANRAGGYTRILRLPDHRIGDGSDQGDLRARRQRRARAPDQEGRRSRSHGGRRAKSTPKRQAV